ncbi:hypothetical protein ACIQMV_37825 [Streptomyces sp. NPDC091412]|uniref:hypothetical protein n=1 Tax=Streptomyces sp. NPDC091412 TaxID=3366002 RepID=UPI0038187EAA
MPQPALTVTVAPGTPREDWCKVCKAYTRLVGHVVVLTAEGVCPAGDWAWCSVCSEPDDREVTRG